MALLPLFFGYPILLGPIHIALLEMVIDPVCALVFEAEREEENVMKRPPRDPAEHMFSIPMVVWSIFQGGVAFAMLATVFLYKTASGMPEVEVRALIFFALIAQVMALILVNRSFTASLVTAFACCPGIVEVWIDCLGRYVGIFGLGYWAVTGAGRLQAPGSANVAGSGWKGVVLLKRAFHFCVMRVCPHFFIGINY